MSMRRQSQQDLGTWSAECSEVLRRRQELQEWPSPRGPSRLLARHASSEAFRVRERTTIRWIAADVTKLG